jgi:vesicle coat complex subunit
MNKNKISDKTIVVFLRTPEKNDLNLPVETIAYFPEIEADPQGNKLSYMHIGQHSAASEDFINECTTASFEHAEELRAELVNLCGYDDLLPTTWSAYKCVANRSTLRLLHSKTKKFVRIFHNKQDLFTIQHSLDRRNWVTQQDYWTAEDVLNYCYGFVNRQTC